MAKQRLRDKFPNMRRKKSHFIGSKYDYSWQCEGEMNVDGTIVVVSCEAKGAYSGNLGGGNLHKGRNPNHNVVIIHKKDGVLGPINLFQRGG